MNCIFQTMYFKALLFLWIALFLCHHEIKAQCPPFDPDQDAPEVIFQVHLQVHEGKFDPTRPGENRVVSETWIASSDSIFRVFVSEDWYTDIKFTAERQTFSCEMYAALDTSTFGADDFVGISSTISVETLVREDTPSAQEYTVRKEDFRSDAGIGGSFCFDLPDEETRRAFLIANATNNIPGAGVISGRGCPPNFGFDRYSSSIRDRRGIGAIWQRKRVLKYPLHQYISVSQTSLVTSVTVEDTPGASPGSHWGYGELEYSISAGQTEFDTHLGVVELEPVVWASLEDPKGPDSAEQVEFLAEYGEERLAIAADGATRLLIKVIDIPSKETPVTVRVCDPSMDESLVAFAGEILNLHESTPGVTELVIPSEQIHQVSINDKEKFVAFAILKAPIDFVGAAAHRQLGKHSPRTLQVRVQVGERLLRKNLALHRPPVLLLHGISDFFTSWKWPILEDPRFFVFTGDYASTNEDSFSNNHRATMHAVRSTLNTMRDRGVAVTRIDAIGHSMGGLLLRQLTADKNYLAEWANYGQGYLHKLITLNTPHFGSEISNILIRHDNTLKTRGELAQAITSRDLTAGGVRDLLPNSAAIARIHLDSKAVPSHAIVGVGGIDWEFDMEYFFEKAVVLFFTYCGFTPNEFFEGENDLVVSALSQAGGLEPPFVSKTFGGDSWHWPTIRGATESSDIAVDLLDESLSVGTRFAPDFPRIPSGHREAPECPLDDISFDRFPDGLELEIQSEAPPQPITDKRFEPGEGVRVGFSQESVDEYEIQRMVAHMLPTGVGAIAEESPYEIVFKLPEDYVGPGKVLVLIETKQGIFFTTCDFIVETDEPIHELIPDQRLLRLSNLVGSQRLTFQVRYNHEDGPLRRVAFNDLNLYFGPVNDEIVIVDDDGMLHAQGRGETLLFPRVDSKLHSSPIRIIVDSIPGDFNADDFVDLSDVEAFIDCQSAQTPSSECFEFFDFDGNRTLEQSDLAKLIQLADLEGPDCNRDALPDSIEIELGIDLDENHDQIPDGCTAISFFKRGEANGDLAINLSDSIFILEYLFVGGIQPSCLDALDVNDSGDIDLADPIGLLVYLFLGESIPAEPFRKCGNDQTEDELSCESFPSC